MEVEIESIQAYLNLIKEQKEQRLKAGNEEEFLFRGQAQDYPLIPKIIRLEPYDNLLKTEKILFQEFKRVNPLLIDPYRSKDDWDYLTIGQNFGLPTRLLDWSNNALTALWFATEISEARNGQQDYAIVWILAANSGDYLNENEQQRPFDITETKLFRPRIIKQRINNQSGIFTVHATSALQQKKSLHELEDYRNKLLKVRISKKHCANIRADLHTLGVNAFSIFPELEGLCAHLQWKFFK